MEKEIYSIKQYGYIEIDLKSIWIKGRYQEIH